MDNGRDSLLELGDKIAKAMNGYDKAIILECVATITVHVFLEMIEKKPQDEIHRASLVDVFDNVVLKRMKILLAEEIKNLNH